MGTAATESRRKKEWQEKKIKTEQEKERRCKQGSAIYYIKILPENGKMI